MFRKKPPDGGWVIDEIVEVTYGLYTGKLGRVRAYSSGALFYPAKVMIDFGGLEIRFIEEKYVQRVVREHRPELLKW